MGRPKHVVNLDEVDTVVRDHGRRFRTRRKQLGAAAGSVKLGCSHYEIPRGTRPFPYHYHTANEEAFFVLEGEGTLRHPDGETPVRAGDWIAFPVGERGAHAITATSESLRLLCISTMIEPEISVMPDSGKYGLFAGAAPGGDPDARTVSAFVPRDAAVDYFDGEDDGDSGTT